VSWSNTSNNSISINKIVDQDARFILNVKFKSNAVRSGVTDQFFDNWYTTWTHPKLAIWVNKIYVEKLSATVEEEFESFSFGLNTPDMQSMNIAKEDERLGKLNAILQRYPAVDFPTEKNLVNILERKIKDTILIQGMKQNNMPRSSVIQWIHSFVNVRETMRKHPERADRIVQNLSLSDYSSNSRNNLDKRSDSGGGKRDQSYNYQENNKRKLAKPEPCRFCGRSNHPTSRCDLVTHPGRTKRMYILRTS
jgi:hypothetical protein